MDLIVIVKERDGTVDRVDIALETGKNQFAVNLTLPDELRKGSNVVIAAPVRTNAKQLATSTVICRPLMRMLSLIHI